MQPVKIAILDSGVRTEPTAMLFGMDKMFCCGYGSSLNLLPEQGGVRKTVTLIITYLAQIRRTIHESSNWGREMIAERFHRTLICMKNHLPGKMISGF